VRWKPEKEDVMRRLLVVMLALGAALTVAGAAQAGCWATAGIEPVPTGVGAGDTWAVTVIVRQHGDKPLAGATPSVILTNEATGERSETAAVPTATKGHYAADVVFPAAGRWDVAVYDGFPEPECAQTHTFGTFAIAGGATGNGGGGGDASGGISWWPNALGAGLAAAALIGFGLAAVPRIGRRPISRRSSKPA
jgi:hypothetical protein